MDPRRRASDLLVAPQTQSDEIRSERLTLALRRGDAELLARWADDERRSPGELARMIVEAKLDEARGSSRPRQVSNLWPTV
mgnify:CR=1 FL=1